MAVNSIQLDALLDLAMEEMASKKPKKPKTGFNYTPRPRPSRASVSVEGTVLDSVMDFLGGGSNRTASAGGKDVETISPAALSGMSKGTGKSGKGGTAAKWGGRAFNTLNAIMVPLMLAQLGLEVHDRMGGDMFGQKKRQRGLAADDITHFLNSNMENTATRVSEETVLPSLLRTAMPYSDMGTSMGAQELMQGAAAQNYIATKTQQLGNMAVPMDQTPTLTEMAARMGLPIA